MGNKASKLTPEQLVDLQKSTYCELFNVVVQILYLGH